MENDRGEKDKPDEFHLFSPKVNHNDAFTLFVCPGESNWCMHYVHLKAHLCFGLTTSK